MTTLAPHFPQQALVSLLFLSLAAGCGGTSDDEGLAGEPPEMRGMTAAHNRARAAVDPPATQPLPPLTWSPQLAAVAQAHADKCVFSHSKGTYGENLFATGGTSATPEDVVAVWVKEAENYDLSTNSCSGTCGHYTQVVWASSRWLGCGVAECTRNSPFGGGSWQLWVCNYDPPGNFIGKPPYE